MSQCVYILGTRVYQCDKEKAAERRLELELDPNGGRTETEGVRAADHTRLVRKSVMGTFASLYIPVTLAPDSGLCRLPSMAEATLLAAM